RTDGRTDGRAFTSLASELRIGRGWIRTNGENKSRTCRSASFVHLDTRPKVQDHAHAANCSGPGVDRIRRAGTPATISPGCTFALTTAPAAIVARSPMITPLVMIEPAPMNTLSPIRTGAQIIGASTSGRSGRTSRPL